MLETRKCLYGFTTRNAYKLLDTFLGKLACSCINSWSLACSKSRSIIALRGPGQFVGEVLLFDSTGRDSPMGSWQTCVRARTQVQALILTVKDLKDLVMRKPAAEVELRAGQHWLFCTLAGYAWWCMRNSHHKHPRDMQTHCLLQALHLGRPFAQPGRLVMAGLCVGLSCVHTLHVYMPGLACFQACWYGAIGPCAHTSKMFWIQNCMAPMHLVPGG